VGVEGRGTVGASLSGQSDLGAAVQLRLVEERLEERVSNAAATAVAGTAR
jgi:hypothetical protein